MYIKRVVVENLKGFAKLDFEFKRIDADRYEGWTVITGDNASGKTALLKAIALALVGPDIARTLQPSFKGWIRNGHKKATIALEIIPDSQDSSAKGGRRVEKSFWSELEFHIDGGPEVTLTPGNKRRGKKKGPLNGLWAENTAGWFSAGYGPFRRLYGASSDAQRLMSGPSRVARFATLFKEDATLSECEIWLKDLSHKKLEERPKESEILADVLLLLNNDFLRNGIRVNKVDSDGLWLTDARGNILPLQDMSEGYRAALAMLIDIVRHIVDVYGGKGLIKQEDGTISVSHPGVVLIDEIDSHLHPDWQREVGFWLKRHFPNIQFIVTTHSPLICQAADAGLIFHMPRPGSNKTPFRLAEEDYAKIIRSRPDAIYLSPAFEMKNTRSPKAVDAQQRYAQLQAKKRVSPLSQKERQLEMSYRYYIDPDKED